MITILLIALSTGPCDVPRRPFQWPVYRAVYLGRGALPRMPGGWL